MTTLFVGLGHMGLPMARHHAAFFPTAIYDADPAAARRASNAATSLIPSLDEVPDQVDTVILMLPDSRAVQSVLTGKAAGLLRKLPRGALVIDMGSSEPSSTRELAALAGESGIGLIDAPVSGGVAKAETGQLTVIIGGDGPALAQARRHVEPMAAEVIHAGPVGAGHAAKALNNLASAANIATAAEVIATAARLGIEPATMLDVLNASTGRSQASEVKFPRHVMTGSYDSGFTMDLMIKDLKTARSLATSLHIEAPVTAAAVETALTAQAELAGRNPDHTELARWYENKNGVAFTQDAKR